MMNSNISTPKLQAPGAGLPLGQSLMMRYFVGPFVSKRDSWQELESRFQKIYERILAETKGLDESALNQVVLVKPLRGIEDSSRNWSVAMTLEHLIFVGGEIAKVILELSHGREIQHEVKIADYKPKCKISGSTAVIEFESFISQTLATIKTKVGSTKSNTTFHHPWFGQFTTHQWFWLLSGHGYIHLKQIQEIKKGSRNLARP
jgi:hypothetical protein